MGEEVEPTGFRALLCYCLGPFSLLLNVGGDGERGRLGIKFEGGKEGLFGPGANLSRLSLTPTYMLYNIDQVFQ